MHREKSAISSILIVLFFCVFPSYARTVDVNIRIRNDSSDEKVLNKANLVAIKKFIINNGLRGTYSQMYNNNPAYQTKRFAFYLIPDTGQGNINCEINKSDFQGLVIRDPNGKNLNCEINFQNDFVIDIWVSGPTEDLTIAKIRKFATDAVEEILAASKGSTSSSTTKPTVSVDTRSLQDAVELAITALNNQTSRLPDNYVLIATEQRFIERKYIWRITFKPMRLIPEDPLKAVKGGETFIDVDLSTKNTKITYGE
jgi:hypothetical protein